MLQIHKLARQKALLSADVRQAFIKSAIENGISQNKAGHSLATEGRMEAQAFIWGYQKYRYKQFVVF